MKTSSLIKIGAGFIVLFLIVIQFFDTDYINKKTMDHCTECQSDDIDYATRVIGYLKKVTNFSKDRQKEEKRRYYGNAEV